MPDWDEIKTAYESGESAYSIGKRTGAKRQTILSRAKRENWAHEVKEESKRKPTAEKNRHDDLGTDDAEEIRITARMLLAEIKVLLADGARPSMLRFYSGALKDVKEILSVKDDRDIREQEARIANLRKQSEGDGDKRIEITINGGEDAWSE